MLKIHGKCTEHKLFLLSLSIAAKKRYIQRLLFSLKTIMHLDLNLYFRVHFPDFIIVLCKVKNMLSYTIRTHLEIHIASLCLIPVKMMYKQVVANKMCCCMQPLCPKA